MSDDSIFAAWGRVRGGMEGRDIHIQILNRQRFKALPACGLINLTSLVSRFYAGSALHV